MTSTSSHKSSSEKSFAGKPHTTYWPCPAKLNLFLHFIGQRDDGYHLIQSYFQLLDFGDELQISLDTSGEIHFSCDQEQLETKDNLVIRAAHLLQQNLQNIQCESKYYGAHLHLIKRLPIGGGVGGGSSDCASTLVALNHLWNTNFSVDELARLGESLGADVPFFVRGHSAFVEGIGEQITPYPIDDAYFLVIQPNCQISTSEIFSNPLLTRNTKAITIRDLKLMGLPFDGLNTIQSLVVEENPEVKEALNWLKNHSSNARMTGSGSCLFSSFDNLEDASKIAALCDPSWLTFVARGTQKSGLYSQIDRS